MSRWNRLETWLALVVGGAGLVILGVAGLWMYVSATATPLHPNAQDVPSVSQSAPAREWNAAVEQARSRSRGNACAPYADTFALASKIAQAFVEQGNAR